MSVLTQVLFGALGLYNLWRHYCGVPCLGVEKGGGVVKGGGDVHLKGKGILPLPSKFQYTTDFSITCM